MPVTAISPFWSDGGFPKVGLVHDGSFLGGQGVQVGDQLLLRIGKMTSCKGMTSDVLVPLIKSAHTLTFERSRA